MASPPPDPDADIRVDLTHHTIVTIDDASTTEVDDGLSVEALPDGRKRLPCTCPPVREHSRSAAACCCCKWKHAVEGVHSAASPGTSTALSRSMHIPHMRSWLANPLQHFALSGQVSVRRSIGSQHV